MLTLLIAMALFTFNSAAAESTAAENLSSASEQKYVVADEYAPTVYYDKTADGIRTIKAKTCKGVCSQEIHISIDTKTDTVKTAQVIGGCPGNLLGISKIIVGMKVTDVISKFLGTPCGSRPTSCPDQIARVLKYTR